VTSDLKCWNTVQKWMRVDNINELSKKMYQLLLPLRNCDHWQSEHIQLTQFFSVKPPIFATTTLYKIWPLMHVKPYLMPICTSGVLSLKYCIVLLLHYYIVWLKLDCCITFEEPHTFGLWCIVLDEPYFTTIQILISSYFSSKWVAQT
jgi:hypothetical protein